jgi:hypothetical protein
LPKWLNYGYLPQIILKLGAKKIYKFALAALLKVLFKTLALAVACAVFKCA